MFNIQNSSNMKTLFYTLVIFVFASQTLSAQPSFFLPTVSAQPNETVCLSFGVRDFTDLQEVRFSLNWNPTVIDYTNIANPNTQVPDLDFGDFDSSLANDGKLSFSWKNGVGCTGNTGITLSDNEILFDICFEVIGDFGESSLIELTNDPTEIFVTRLNANCNRLYLQTSGLINWM